MDKKILLTLAVATAVGGALFAAKKDPAVMKIAGKEVPRSEFEYLYNKNAGQQLEQQSLEEYAQLFKIYKLKVADALAEQLDTSAAFQKEYLGYTRELAQPFMTDSAVYKEMLQKMHDRSGEEVEAIHIMFFKPREFGGQLGRQAWDRADSVLNLLKNGSDFAALAEQLSQDRGSAVRGGSMGYITAGQTPGEFEDVVYTLPEGQISGLVESPVGIHIVKGGKHRKARGTVHVLHILKMVSPDAPAEQQSAALAKIDSLYQAATAPDASFEAIAAKESDDKNSARRGGDVGWFGTGRMLPEFDSVSFALAPGEISKPVRTRAGWHIIKKLEAKDVPSFAEAEETYRGTIEAPNGPYARQMYTKKCTKLRKKFGFNLNEKLLKQMKEASTVSGTDSTFVARFKNSPEVLASWKGGQLTAGDFADYISRFAVETSPVGAPAFIQHRLDNNVNAAMMKLQLEQLPEENEDYRNLIGEYHDGMLLFEVSNRKVWEKAAKDTEGLKAFFEKNRADYTWQQPHAKGFLVQAPDATMGLAVEKAIAKLPREQVLDSIRSQFPDVKIDPVLAAKGENQMVDALVFGGGEVQNPDSKYPVFYMADLRILNAPEELDDVRVQATADYQNELERLWVEELEAKYPVEIYPKELAKVKVKK